MHALHRLRHRLEDLELLLPTLLHLHYRRQVIASVAVVRRTPHSHQVLVLNHNKLTLNQWMYPSCTNWCARAISYSPFMWQKSLVTLDPNTQHAPRALIAQSSMCSGSDHIKSQKGPLWGISILRWMVRTWSIVLI
jgi:hypothetical protein